MVRIAATSSIVEEGEEYDCGRAKECDEVDRCCVARDDDDGLCYARRALLSHLVKNQWVGRARTHQVSTTEFNEIVGETDFVYEDGNVRDSGHSL